MNKNIKEYVKKKKRRKKIKKIILFIFVIIIGLVIFVYKSTLFNMKKINIYGLVNLNEEEIQETIKYTIGQNIFTIKYNKIKADLKENPYINSVKISKKGINTLKIEIEENKISYYYQNGEVIKTINNEGVISEEIKSLEGRNLIKLTGIDLSEKNIGETISDNNKLSSILENFYKMKEVMPENYSFSEININNINDIKCKIGEVEVIIGNDENLMDKINLALNLMDQGIIKKGYIDASFEGPPVIKVEK